MASTAPTAISVARTTHLVEIRVPPVLRWVAVAAADMTAIVLLQTVVANLGIELGTRDAGSWARAIVPATGGTVA